MSTLHLHRFGPAGAVSEVLALHGLTGHGRRFERLAHTRLPGVGIAAPDLRGHGRSPWAPPWTLEAHLDDLSELLDERVGRPAVLVGHSFGGNLAVRLALRAPEAVRALILLDPAMGLARERARDTADAYLHSPGYPDAAEARAEKAHGGWADVAPDVLDADLAEHLIDSPFGGVTWRACAPAVVTAWGEMARPACSPPAGVPTTLVRARRVDPPFLSDAVVADWRAALGDSLTVTDLDCEHMVSQSHPDLVAQLIHAALGRGRRPWP